MRTLSLTVAVLATIIGAPAANASTVQIATTISRTIVDVGRDGFDTVSGQGLVPFVGSNANAVNRVASEYDLSAIPQGSTVNAANVAFDVGYFGSANIYGYFGDGSITVSDALNTSNLLYTFQNSYNNGLGAGPISFDAAGFLQQALSAGAGFVGFLAVSTDESVQDGSNLLLIGARNMTVDFNPSTPTPSPVPLPAAAPLLLLGISSLALSRSRRKKDSLRRPA